MTQLYILSFSSFNADFELNKIQLKMAGITTPPCVIFFYEHTISVFPLKYLTYNDWVWRNIKIAKYFYNVEKLGKKNIDQVCIWEKYEPFCEHIKLTTEISIRHWLNHKTLHWETSTQYKVLWQNKVLSSQEL